MVELRYAVIENDTNLIVNMTMMDPDNFARTPENSPVYYVEITESAGEAVIAGTYAPSSKKFVLPKYLQERRGES